MDSVVSSFENLTQASVLNIDIDLYTIPLWRQIMWIILFLIVMIIGTAGNIIVLWIIIAHRTMQTVTNLYIANLAIADILIALINVPFTAFALIFGDWPFGLFLCQLNEGVATICICVYVITLLAVSVNRYKMVIAMIKQQERAQQTGIITIIIWIVSIFVAAPNWIFATIDGNSSEPDDVVQNGRINIVAQCGPKWTDKYWEQWYGWLYMIASFLLPLILMTYTYGRISFKLWRSSIVGTENRSQHIKDRAEKKIIKMMVVVTLIFAIFWFPLRVYSICGVSGMTLQVPSYKNDVYLLIFWLAMTNCIYNPFIYYFMNADFHAGFRIAFMWCPKLKWDSEEEDC